MFYVYFITNFFKFFVILPTGHLRCKPAWQNVQ